MKKLSDSHKTKKRCFGSLLMRGDEKCQKHRQNQGLAFFLSPRNASVRGLVSLVLTLIL